MIGIIIMTIVALIIGIVLVSVHDFANKENKYLKYLPGYNCGACGFINCEKMSEAMIKDVNNYKKCRLLKDEKLEELEKIIK